jgi:hypothetical protein
MSDSEKVEVDESDESNLFVVDPDDYQKTRKLKAINDAKEHVHKLRRDMPARTSKSEWSGIHSRLTEAVAMYGSELQPLIEDALQREVLEKEDLETEYCSVLEFIHFDGRIDRSDADDEIDLEAARPIEYMAVFRQLDRIQRKLGLGLQLQEDKGPAEI